MNFPVLCRVVLSGEMSFVVYGCVLVDCFCNHKLKQFKNLCFSVILLEALQPNLKIECC